MNEFYKVLEFLIIVSLKEKFISNHELHEETILKL